MRICISGHSQQLPVCTQGYWSPVHRPLVTKNRVEIILIYFRLRQNVTNRYMLLGNSEFKTPNLRLPKRNFALKFSIYNSHWLNIWTNILIIDKLYILWR